LLPLAFYLVPIHECLLVAQRVLPSNV
jgi:hypothetical protein